MPDKLPFKKANRWIGPAALATALLILMAAAWFTYQNVKEFAETGRWVSQSREVLLTTQTIMRKLNKAESAGRGYLLTDEPHYREQFDSSIKFALEGKANLKKLTSDNEDQRKRVSELAEMIEPGVELMKKLVSRWESPEPESAEADSLLEKETAIMEAIREIVGEIERVEDSLLMERTSSHGKRLADTRTSLLLSAIISSLVVLGTFFLLRRHWNLERTSNLQSSKDQKEMEELSLYNQRLLESTGEGIYGIDIDGGCTFINTAGALILGGKPEDFLGEEMHGLVHHKKANGDPFPVPKNALSMQRRTPVMHAELTTKSSGDWTMNRYPLNIPRSLSRTNTENVREP